MVGFGTALAGYGEAVPQIQQLQAMQQKKQQEAGIANALKMYAAQQQGGMRPPMPAAGGMPGAAPTATSQAGGPPSPANGPTPPTQAPPAAGTAPAPSQNSFAGGMPDLNSMITMLSKSNMSPDQQYEALQSYGAFASPFEKMQNQLTMTQQKLQSQSELLDERLKEMDRLGKLRADVATRGQDIGSANVDKRVGAQERGQDVSASNTNKRVGATERGQDITAGTAKAKLDESERHHQALEFIYKNKDITQQQKDAIRSKENERHNKAMETISQQKADTGDRKTSAGIIQGEEGLKIKQQQADTGSARQKSQDTQGQERIDLSTKSLKEKNDLVARGQDKQYQAKLAAIAARGTPQQQSAFKAAQSEFTQASANYRNAKMVMTSSPEDVAAMADKAAAAQQKMESEAAKIQSAGGSKQGSGSAAPLISTQAEYDKLPSGAQYMDENGGPYTKK